MRLSSRVMLVTGAGSGIGRAMALHFAKEGADIVLGDLKVESAQETAKSIESLGRRALPLKVDISHLEEVQSMVAKAYETFERIDILVNNAGIFPVPAPVIKLPEKVFDQCIAINLRGTFLCSKYIGQKMIHQKNIPGSELRGKIINIASMAGEEG